MIRVSLIATILVLGIQAAAQESDVDRDPASLVLPTSSAKRLYPGGGDEEDLKVLSALPEAISHTDARSIQKEVYKGLYNQELKEESNAPMEE